MGQDKTYLPSLMTIFFWARSLFTDGLNSSGFGASSCTYKKLVACRRPWLPWRLCRLFDDKSMKPRRWIFPLEARLTLLQSCLLRNHRGSKISTSQGCRNALSPHLYKLGNFSTNRKWYMCKLNFLPISYFLYISNILMGCGHKIDFLY